MWVLYSVTEAPPHINARVCAWLTPHPSYPGGTIRVRVNTRLSDLRHRRVLPPGAAWHRHAHSLIVHTLGICVT